MATGKTPWSPAYSLLPFEQLATHLLHVAARLLQEVAEGGERQVVARRLQYRPMGKSRTMMTKVERHKGPQN
jgi:hypothetical protein